MRTFLWSGAGSALSVALYLLYVGTVGVGSGSDAFFATLAVAQTLGGLLFAPYETFAQRFALDRLRAGGAPAAPLVASYLLLSAAVLGPYYLWGEALFGPLFASTYAADPALWRYHFLTLGALVPLTGTAAMIQVCCQARERYELPKVAAAVSRVGGLGLLLLAGGSRLRAMSVVVVLIQVAAVAASAAGAGAWRAAPGDLVRDARAALREWLRVNRWTMILKTDQLLERVLAARVMPGFLSLFNVGWSAVTALVEAFHAGFVVGDSNRYHTAGSGERGAGGLGALLAGPYARSRAVAVRLSAAAAALAGAGAVAAMSTGWTPGGVPAAHIGLLLATLVLALVAFLLWKQLAGAYAIQHRAVEFARGLTLVYLAFAGPRIVLTWQLGALGFCVGLVGYYGTQVWVLGKRI